jgi:predicted TPR repeat methyltransferase
MWVALDVMVKPPPQSASIGPHGSVFMAQLQEAVALHKRGQFAEAETLYRRILDILPHQFDALHMLGVLEAQRGNAQAAVDLIGHALKIDRRNPAAHNNHGNALRALGRHKEALASFDRALALRPDYAEALVNRGNALRDLGRTAQALASYDKAIAVHPSNVEALNNRGNALRELKRPQEALASFDRSLALRPDNPEVLSNRGNTLCDLGRHEEAIASFERALTLKPDYAQAHYNRGNALRDLGRYDAALASYDRALELQADYAEAHNNRGVALRALGRLEEALAAFDRVLVLRPDHADALENRGHVLNIMKRPNEAVASFEAARAAGGDRDLIAYYLAALGAAPQPPTPPRSYVEDLFDQYATRFDERLLSLNYDVPRQLFEAAVDLHPEGARDIADLGCGTGMCGQFFRPVARTLVGVDLSANMIEQSRVRGVYDRLVKGDVTEFLRANPDAFDLVIAADVFIYVGDVDAVFGATWGALRPGGQFAFSVEALDGDGFVLLPSRRYAHSLGYVRALAVKYEFTEKSALPIAVRQQEGRDLPGFIVVLEKSPV